MKKFHMKRRFVPLPPKKDMKMSPEKLGLTQREVVYLFVFKELEENPQHPAAMFNKMQESISENFLKSRANFYAAIDEMTEKTWISFIIEGRKKIYSLTDEGKEKLEWYRKTYYLPFFEVKKLADFLLHRITGSRENHPPQEQDFPYQKLFNRLINVRELVIYLFLQALARNHERTAKEIYKQIQEYYGWKCSVGYIYELAHEMEQKEWLKGRWKGSRRTEYLYRLTDAGLKVLPKAEESSVYYIRNVQRFMKTVVYLLD